MQDRARPIRFHHRGRIVEAAGLAPTTTVLDWLREHAHCTGTKEGCAEGDCGACTVVVGTRDDGGGLALKAVNACTAFLPTLDGKALLTVEDLGGDHPVQQAMVECHGSQCGFCTPGFVMSMWACYERCRSDGSGAPSRQALADELSGNLCRCTGYRPILDAGQRMFELPARRHDAAPVLRDLRALAADPPLAGPGFHAPRTLDDLAALRAAKPEARLLAGSTDIGLWVTKQLRDLGELVYLGDVAELRRIEEAGDGTLHIGAGATLEAAWAAIARRHPALADMWRRFASPPVRNAGTMGGNVANGSPIGDAPPVLMALGASLVLRRGAATRTLALDDFYLDYMKNKLEPGEFVQALVVPPDPALVVRGYKVSKRYDSDISAVACGLAIELAGGIVTRARFAYGGMAATCKRAAGAEAAVTGQPWTEATVRAAMAALDADFQPLTDLRAGAAYRKAVAANLLRRFWLETRDGSTTPDLTVRRAVEAVS